MKIEALLVSAHVFFDDAFVPLKNSSPEGPLVNSYVKTLVATMDEAATHVYSTNVRLRPPKKVPTPYGGKLIWTLPGKTKLVAHLKDKNKIRPKKRWSQVKSLCLHVCYINILNDFLLKGYKKEKKYSHKSKIQIKLVISPSAPKHMSCVKMFQKAWLYLLYLEC